MNKCVISKQLSRGTWLFVNFTHTIPIFPANLSRFIIPASYWAQPEEGSPNVRFVETLQDTKNSKKNKNISIVIFVANKSKTDKPAKFSQPYIPVDSMVTSALNVSRGKVVFELRDEHCPSDRKM